MDNHMPLLKPYGFSDMIEIPAEGQSGSMVILWDHTLVNVHSFVRRSQEISATIEVISTHKSWLFSFIYASTNVNCRNQLWNNLVDMHANYKGPWFVGGDFNDVLTSNEKLGGNRVNRNRAKYLWDCINKCNLIDLGFKGCKFTWSNHRRKNKRLIMERLDKIFANNDWFSYFPNAIVTHLLKTHSDYNPLLLQIIPKTNMPFRNPLDWKRFWCRHSDFSNLVKDSWKGSIYHQASNIFLGNVRTWKNKVFGNIFKKKRRIVSRLKGIQESEHYPNSDFLQNLEQSLQAEYNNYLKIEDDYWKLRARISWIQDGDANTKFFHIMASNRKR
ncbi:uncharacterized protein [Nicotiana tomentosiformis]|uniref:uncharacterized protein n=1 Tax=Nicotiana tomentosiformis TaxID=4098 RepID=UPI00388CAF8B